MSLAAITYYTVVCDECGADFNADSEYSAWSDPDSATLILDSPEYGSDWSTSPDRSLHRCPDHNPFCERCGQDAGPFCGERDYLCPSCWATSEEAP